MMRPIVPDRDRGGAISSNTLMSNLSIIQLNCHNAYHAFTELNLKMSNYKNVISLIQEPYVDGKKQIKNCPKGYDRFPGAPISHIRTAIFASQHLKLTEISELSDENATTVGGIINGEKTLFSSIYLHYDKPVIPVLMKKIINYARQHAFQLIIGCLLYTSDAAATPYV